MLKKALIGILVFYALFPKTLNAQTIAERTAIKKLAINKLRVETGAYEDTAKLVDVIIKRIRNVSFTQQTLNYAPLSYASPPFSELGSEKNGYILSADISPNFVIGGSGLPTPIHLTARYKVRIFKDNALVGDKSLPVRTPSFMPGITIFIPLQRYLYNESIKLKYLSVAFFHHSDGQDGDEIDKDGKINLYSGNFSTNYLELAYHFRNRHTSFFGHPYKSGYYHDFYTRVGYEQHIGTAAPLKSSYGDERLNLSMIFLKVKEYKDKVLSVRVDDPYQREHFRVTFNTSFIASGRDRGLSKLQKRINADLTYHWRVIGSPNTSLFSGVGYYGSDPYNIYYEKSYGFVRFGVALGFFVTPGMLSVK
jgi:hypothetical protein